MEIATKFACVFTNINLSKDNTTYLNTGQMLSRSVAQVTGDKTLSMHPSVQQDNTGCMRVEIHTHKIVVDDGKAQVVLGDLMLELVAELGLQGRAVSIVLEEVSLLGTTRKIVCERSQTGTTSFPTMLTAQSDTVVSHTPPLARPKRRGCEVPAARIFFGKDRYQAPQLGAVE